MSPNRLVLLLAWTLLLGACAPTAKSPVNNPEAPKCYTVDSTKFLTPEHHARVFEAVETEGHAFGPCADDSLSPQIVRIRPKSSHFAGPAASYTALGVNVVTKGAVFGLAIAQTQPLWLLLSGVQFGPQAGILYEAEYLDPEGKEKREKVIVSRSPWFESRDTSRARLMREAPRDLSVELYGKVYPKEKPPALSGRISLDIAPILFIRLLDETWISPRYEHILPGNFALNFMPQWFLTHSGKSLGGSVQGGPRRYFFGSHAPVFVGVEPYYEYQVEDGVKYSRMALPVTVGIVDQAKGFFTGFDVGYGPAWVLEGAYKREKDYLFMALYMGWAY